MYEIPTKGVPGMLLDHSVSLLDFPEGLKHDLFRILTTSSSNVNSPNSYEGLLYRFPNFSVRAQNRFSCHKESGFASEL